MGGAFLVIYVAIFGVFLEAWRARGALQVGRQPSSSILSFGTENPWSSQVAEFDWAAQKKPAGAPALPRCALYLGEAGGTAVIYSAPDNHTWRLPSSALIVTAMPERDSC